MRTGANKDKKENGGLFSLFQGGADSFFKIGQDVTLEKDFRYKIPDEVNCVYKLYLCCSIVLLLDYANYPSLELQQNQLEPQHAPS